MNCARHPQNPSWWGDKRRCYECAMSADQRSEAEVSAFEQGREAYEAGDELWQNDYTDDDMEHSLAEQWREGWLKAAEDYVREAESNDMDKVLDDPRRGQARSINRS
jgi:hypothetical protein